MANIPGATEEWADTGSSKGGSDKPMAEIPADCLGGYECKAGDVLQCKVVGHTQDGGVQVEVAHPDSQETMDKEMDAGIFGQSKSQPQPEQAEGEETDMEA